MFFIVPMLAELLISLEHSTKQLIEGDIVAILFNETSKEPNFFCDPYSQSFLFRYFGTL